MGIKEAFEKQRMEYQQRYSKYIREYNADEKNMDAHGHAMECSYVLATVFGLNQKELRELDRNNYAGFLERDLEE